MRVQVSYTRTVGQMYRFNPMFTPSETFEVSTVRNKGRKYHSTVDSSSSAFKK